MPSKKLSLRDHVDGSRLDLSMSDLDEVPVREIAQTKKVTELDLSNNRLTTLGKNFPTLTQIVKLDLSKNHLVELPGDFGNLILLRHLDLYSNQLTHLPLSFCQLKSLKWLDLKNNPLVPRLAEVVGPCLDAQQCQRSAKVVVPFLQEMKDQIEAKIIKRQEQKKLEKQEAAMQEKPREQKKKKKGAKQNDKNQNKPSTGSKDKAKAKKSSEKALNHNLLEENSLATDVKNAGSSFWKKLIIFLLMCISSLSVCIFFMQEENSSLQHILNGAYNNFNEWYIFITKSEIGVISTIACAAASMVQFIKLVILYSFTKIEEVYQHMQNENITVEVKSSLNGLWQILCQKTKDVYVSFKEEFPSGGS